MYLRFFSPWSVLTIKVTVFTAVTALMSIVAWIGYTMATTPPPGPLEDLLTDIENIEG
jgi:predicted DNA-binding transcriptional regulator